MNQYLPSMISVPHGIPFPTPLSAYPPPSSEGFWPRSRSASPSRRSMRSRPSIFVACHPAHLRGARSSRTSRISCRSGTTRDRGPQRLPASSKRRWPEILHFFGEVEVVFGLWAVVLAVAMAASVGWDTTRHYLNDTVNYTEPLFVVVIMALASTRPIINLAEGGMRRIAGLGGATPAAWWLAILIVGPLLGSFITEPAAMTICALLLSRQFFDLNPSRRLKYATLGLLFVNVSVGGTLTHFAAPPVLMVARPWGWDTPFMLGHFGWRAIVAVTVSTVVVLRDIPPRNARALDASRASPTSTSPKTRRLAAARLRCSRFPLGDRGACPVHGVDRGELALSRRSSSAASSSSSALRGRPPPIKAESISKRRCWSDSSWRVWSSTAACRAGGSRRCWRACPRRHCISAPRY